MEVDQENESHESLLYRILFSILNVQIGRYTLYLWLEKTYNYIESEVFVLATQYLPVSHGGEEVKFDDLNRDADTLFVMGSGSSLNDITDEEWERLADTGDVLAFNHFFRGEFVPVDFHIVRETEKPGFSLFHYGPAVEEYVDGIQSNPCYDDTTFFVLSQRIQWHDRAGVTAAWAAYALKGFRDHRICLYQNKDEESDPPKPGDRIDEVAHGAATLFDAINIGYLMRYDRIVLLGVDLYDRRYFWFTSPDDVQDADKREGADADTEHNTASPVLDIMPHWRDYLAERGVELTVENERSLLHTEGILESYDL